MSSIRNSGTTTDIKSTVNARKTISMKESQVLSFAAVLNISRQNGPRKKNRLLHPSLSEYYKEVN
jgi:hypothetical protein